MATAAQKPSVSVEAFDEKQFYLDEFRGKTLLLSIPGSELQREEDHLHLGAVVRELLRNHTRVIVLVGTDDAASYEPMKRRLLRRLGPLIFRDETISLFPQRRGRSSVFVELPAAATDVATTQLSNIWLALRRGPLCLGIVPDVPSAGLTQLAQVIAARLRLHKLVLIEPAGGIAGADGKPLSFMDEVLLATLLSAGQAEWAGLGERRPVLSAIRSALLGGVTSVNLCRLDGLARELFTYVGSGTLCTLADYCQVQRLGIDDFEEVERLIERGQREGLLKIRGVEEVARLLVNGYGATIGTHHLAGICALETEPYRGDHAGEVVALYTITRFKGEGVGSKLLARVIADARAAGLDYVFACTSEERAQGFFEREGFVRVAPDRAPAAKWVGYDPRRRAQVVVLRRELKSDPSSESPYSRHDRRPRESPRS